MLVQFTVGNYLSFEAETTFSLRATSDARLPHHVVTNADGVGGKALGVLRAAALYGANGAGKSNLIAALSFAQQLIGKGTSGGAAIAVRPFKLGAPGEASRFEFIFRHEDVLYSYGFAVSAQRVHEEWLFATPKKREQRWFERVTDAEGKVQVEFGPSLKKAAGGARLGFIVQDTRPNQLLLTELGERNIEAVAPILEWFSDVLVTLGAESRFSNWPLAVMADEDLTQFASNFLHAAGTGVEAIESRQVPVDIEQLCRIFPEEERSDFLSELESLQDDEVLICSGSRDKAFVTLNDEGKPCVLDIWTVHRTAEGETVRFRLNEESDGTQRLFHLVPLLLALKNEPKVVVIDELDRRLHTHLARLFVQQALECGEDDLQGQLIYTTHDTNLLDLDLLRRDEIWFVEKAAGGATHLASLAEWKVRPDLEIERGYLNGRFGAIPFFGDVSRLLCADEISANGKGKLVKNEVAN